MTRIKNSQPQYCPFCGHLLQELETEEEIRSCYICGNNYLIHSFLNSQYVE